MSDAIGIYNVYGLKGESKIFISHKETVYPKEGEQVTDMIIDDYKIGENIVGKICACNLTHHYLLSTKTLPLFYVSVMYEVPLKTVLLYRIYFVFTIDDDIKSSEQLIESPVGGKFFVEIFIGDTKKVIDNIDIFTGNDEIYKKMIDFTKSDGMREMVDVMVGEIAEKLREQYQDTTSYEIPENIISLKNYKFDDDI